MGSLVKKKSYQNNITSWSNLFRICNGSILVLILLLYTKIVSKQINIHWKLWARSRKAWETREYSLRRNKLSLDKINSHSRKVTLNMTSPTNIQPPKKSQNIRDIISPIK